MVTDEYEDEFGGPPYSNFSAGYVLVENVEVRRWSDEMAGMPFDLYETLAIYNGEPVIGYVGGRHYEFRPMYGIPDKTVAVPRDNHERSPGPFLLQK
ncbi:hypothetical protein HCTV-15_gp2 [Haloarcula virus HCTV-15]|nr:hypothetical protein HCTV-6_gp2 [Haloarcula virus HCTV-6]UBF22476.1 hypothetical protein HCTV-15_gp2 [Haloarcula virus HCTV-15]